MNLDNTELLIKKINRLYDIIKSFGEASSTEKDLLKAYVIDLYEAVAMSDISTSVDIEENEIKERLKNLKKQEKKLKKQVEKKRIEVEIDIEEVEETAKEVKEDIKEEKVQKPEEKVNAKISDEILDLFNFSNNSELSDKLANAPIKDLTKSMGINEKIFTVKELFGGNNKEMDTILLALNGLNDFEEAKSILSRSVASKYDWTAPSKIKKAKNFIKLVRRRYI